MTTLRGEPSAERAVEVEAEPRLALDRPVLFEEPHRVLVSDEGSFTVARCSCGWRSYARRSRGRARAEGEDHTRLHAPPAAH